MKGFIVYGDYLDIDDETHIRLFGRLENGQSFTSLHKFEPYFFVPEKSLKKVSKYLKNYKVDKISMKDFKGNKVVKISSPLQREINKLYKAIHKHTEIYEADIKPYQRFIIDNNLLGSLDIEGDYSSQERVDRFYKNPSIKAASFMPKLKILSIDIESDKNSDKLFCIGLCSENFKKNFMITDKKIEHVVSCKSEVECLEKVKSELLKFDPDIITGWNIIDFDFLYLQKLYKKHKIEFDLGRVMESIRLRIESNFFRSSSADVPGRQVLDALNLIRDPFIKEAPMIKQAEFDSYSLEDVSQAILGKGKLLVGKERHDEIESLYSQKTEKSLQKLADYNLLDCQLVYEILAKTQMIDLAVERSHLTGMPLDRITASIAAFDSLYIREAKKRDMVCPTTHYVQKETRIKGGYTFSANPGIYHNVLILDFKSLYPSIIKTFNIDPSSFLQRKSKNAIESPNKAYFKNTNGILPDIITKLHEAREKAKRDGRELSNYAIKIIMNSFFGVLASPNCRFFDLKMANAITHFGQMIIKLTAEQIEKKDFKVIYSDTDSVFVESVLSKEKANALGHQIQGDINSFYKNFVKKKYHRESFLELQFAKQYLSFMLPAMRKSDEEQTAAKKRYAGLLEKNGKEEIEIVGLEAIRGDWTEVAQEFQVQLLDKAFHKEPLDLFIRNYVKKILSGQLDKKLIYRKSIRKNLSEYTKTTPPHVKAARQLEKMESNVVEYYITEEGPEPIQKLRHKIDYEHYINKQIAPIANQVLSLIGKKFEDIVKPKSQTTLF